MTRPVPVSPTQPDPAAIAQAAAHIRNGELVAFPTETVYGLGADALNPEAVSRIYQAKGRPPTNPLIVHVTGPEMARRVVAEWPEAAERLAAAFWPGPLTLVLPKRPEVSERVSAGLPSVGVRVPAHPIAQALIRAADRPIAAPSANPYMGVSPTTAQHVAAGLGDRVAMILDGGPAQVGLESTVLDLTRPVPTVLRPGGLSIARLREVLGEVATLAQAEGEDFHLPSPGLAKRHYAPAAQVRLVEEAGLARAAQELLVAGERVGALGFAQAGPAGVVYERMPAEPEAYGARLYAALHDFDAAGVTRLLVALPPKSEAWVAVRDRLERAASG